MKRINIMTSCDNNLAKYILPQLVSIEKNLCEYNVHFYLAHSRIFPENVQMLKDFAKSQTHIAFHDIKVTENLSFYQSLVDGGGQWPFEAYFTLRVQDYLPEDVDRVLYIDAGDVIINGDIAPYYFDDFEGKSIIATPLCFKINPISNEQELYTKEDILTVAHASLFNSGSYVINLENFRKDGYTISDYEFLAALLKKNKGSDGLAYFGDQGFLAAAFVEDIKFFGYPNCKDPSYMPYDFRSSYWGLFKNELTYNPIILHYAIKSKPWVVRFSEDDINEVIDSPNFVGKYLVTPISNIALMTPQHLRLCEVWWKYAEETPIYEELNTRATITAESWVKYYLPMCAKYITTYFKLTQAEKNSES